MGGANRRTEQFPEEAAPTLTPGKIKTVAKDHSRQRRQLWEAQKQIKNVFS